MIAKIKRLPEDYKHQQAGRQKWGAYVDGELKIVDNDFWKLVGILQDADYEVESKNERIPTR